MSIDYRSAFQKIKEDAAYKAQKIKEDIQAARKSEETDDPIDVFIYDPIAIRLTYLFIRLGWSPNAVTIMSMIFGIGGSVLLVPKKVPVNLLGIASVLFAAILDCCDGQIARLTHSSSQLGRVLDGCVDMVNYLAIYVALGFRLMGETVSVTPTFTLHVSWYIWIVILLTAVFHAGQARMADYYRGLHLYFLKGSSDTYLTRSHKIREEIAALPEDAPLFKRLYLRIYLMYTAVQEAGVPHTQQLLDRIEENGGTVPVDLAVRYTDQSRKIIQVTNLLSFNIRTYTLFLLLLFGKEVFFFPFVFIVLELLKLSMIGRYETIAGRICTEYYGEAGTAPKHAGLRRAGRKQS